MTLALLFALVDLAVAGYLLWYARRRQRGPREPLAVVALVLLLCAGFLGVVAWRAAHPRVHVVDVVYRGSYV